MKTFSVALVVKDHEDGTSTELRNTLQALLAGLEENGYTYLLTQTVEIAGE